MMANHDEERLLTRQLLQSLTAGFQGGKPQCLLLQIHALAAVLEDSEVLARLEAEANAGVDTDPDYFHPLRIHIARIRKEVRDERS